MNNDKSIVSSDISYSITGNQAMWAELATTPIGKLRLAEAYLARITVGPWETRKMLMDELRGWVGGHIRDAKPQDVLNDPHCHGLVRHLYGEPGINRLKKRVEENAVRETSGQ